MIRPLHPAIKPSESSARHLQAGTAASERLWLQAAKLPLTMLCLHHPALYLRGLSRLTNNRGGEGVGWKRCGSCHANARSEFSLEHEGSTTARSSSGESFKEVTKPFTEAEVQRILVKHLSKQGYEITASVPCPSGYIDLVAKKAEQSTLVEVNGEDRGGYTSAEMNFQMGLGQIISRMTDPKASYALAIPVTNDYLRVLKKYKGSLGLERLDLNFFLVRGDEDVESYTAPGFTKFVGGLR